jgi:hypothetical protein
MGDPFPAPACGAACAGGCAVLAAAVIWSTASSGVVVVNAIAAL